jgi:thiosulfate/3-mercaptopyruvate sulfurtransferase
MKTTISIILLLAITLSVSAFNMSSSQGNQEPWTPQQLLNPAELAKVLNNPKSAQPLVYSIGMQAIIKGSIDIGPVMRNAQIVVYCGCCPFDRCPNIRPAMELLKNMQFKNYKLLNLPQNIKVDWIDLGYPINE